MEKGVQQCTTFLFSDLGFQATTHPSHLRSLSSSTSHHSPVHLGEHEQTKLFPTLRHPPCTHRSMQDCNGGCGDDVVVDVVVVVIIVVVVFDDVVELDDTAAILCVLVQVISKFIK